MATKSFYETLELETPEQIEIVVKLIEETDLNLRTSVNTIDVASMVEEGSRLIDEGFLDKLYDNSSQQTNSYFFT